MTLDQLKFQREALLEQLRLVDFRIARLIEAEAAEHRNERDAWLKSAPQPTQLTGAR